MEFLLFLMPEFGIKIEIFLNKITRGRRRRKNLSPIFFSYPDFLSLTLLDPGYFFPVRSGGGQILPPLEYQP